MYTWMKMLAEMAYAFGVEGAGSPSHFGNYEMPVPEELMEREEE